jgi:hypothetical protein
MKYFSVLQLIFRDRDLVKGRHRAAGRGWTRVDPTRLSSPFREYLPRVQRHHINGSCSSMYQGLKSCMEARACLGAGGLAVLVCASTLAQVQLPSFVPLLCAAQRPAVLLVVVASLGVACAYNPAAAVANAKKWYNTAEHQCSSSYDACTPWSYWGALAPSTVGCSPLNQPRTHHMLFCCPPAPVLRPAHRSPCNPCFTPPPRRGVVWVPVPWR